MAQAFSTTSAIAQKISTPTMRRIGILYARLALGTAFLSAVSGRFGLWDGHPDMAHFKNFLAYAATDTLAFLPRAAVPLFASTATVLEIFLGISLILGLWSRWVALGSAVLLALFAISMTLSTGLKPPMDYSVFSASAGAFLLALIQTPQQNGNA